MEGKSIAACSAYTFSINESYCMDFVNYMHSNSDLWHINIRPNETVLICSDQKPGWILKPGSLEICDFVQWRKSHVMSPEKCIKIYPEEHISGFSEMYVGSHVFLMSLACGFF